MGERKKRGEKTRRDEITLMKKMKKSRGSNRFL